MAHGPNVIVGWSALTRAGRIANRRWYRNWRRWGCSRHEARMLAEAQIFGAYCSRHADWATSR